ncbi:hypothetical protein BJ944DRAFT_234973 [Cunninghamella echinulata]|nr:hypothetical protein BJ944DRAFT_234973 [Cunninghamella echinulata]
MAKTFYQYLNSLQQDNKVPQEVKEIKKRSPSFTILVEGNVYGTVWSNDQYHINQLLKPEEQHEVQQDNLSNITEPEETSFPDAIFDDNQENQNFTTTTTKDLLYKWAYILASTTNESAISNVSSEVSSFLRTNNQKINQILNSTPTTIKQKFEKKIIILTHSCPAFLFITRLTLSYAINNLSTSLSDTIRSFIGCTEFDRLVKLPTEFNNKELDEEINEVLDTIIKTMFDESIDAARIKCMEITISLLKEHEKKN